MGNQPAKPASAADRAATARAREDKVAETRQKVKDVQAAAVAKITTAQAAAVAAASVPTNPFAITTEREATEVAQKAAQQAMVLVGAGPAAEPVNAELLIGATAIADRQLQRSGDAFTKDDYVAILLFIAPELRAHHASVSQQTVANLRAKIRTLIYDPERFTGTNAVALGDPRPPLAITMF